MTIRAVRYYWMATRCALPLMVIAAAAESAATWMYFSTDRLGLLKGPLGWLRSATLGGDLPQVTMPFWASAGLILVSILGLAVEASRARRASQRDRRYRVGLALAGVLGFTFMAFHQAQQFPAQWLILMALALAAAVALSVGLWRVWPWTWRAGVVTLFVLIMTAQLAGRYLVDVEVLGRLPSGP